jgi:hypothetical protein
MTGVIQFAILVVAALGAPAPKPAAKVPPPRPAVRPADPGLAVIDRWLQLTPQQRERALAKLPPDRQRPIRERLDRWNKLTPQEKERLRMRYDQFSHLPPDRQALVRRQIQNFAKMPNDRRPFVSKELDSLRRLPDSDLRARVNSEEFRSRFSPREQEILRDLAENMAAPTRQSVQAGR